MPRARAGPRKTRAKTASRLAAALMMVGMLAVVGVGSASPASAFTYGDLSLFASIRCVEPYIGTNGTTSEFGYYEMTATSADSGRHSYNVTVTFGQQTRISPAYPWSVQSYYPNPGVRMTDNDPIIHYQGVYRGTVFSRTLYEYQHVFMAYFSWQDSRERAAGYPVHYASVRPVYSQANQVSFIGASLHDSTTCFY